MDTAKIYLTVFIIKVIGSALANYRLILMNDGNKTGVFITSFFSTLSWILSISLVMEGINEDPFISVPFVLGIVTGSYLGIFFDKHLKSGKILTTVVTTDKNIKLLDKIKKEGFEVASFKAEGKDGNKEVLMIASSRKKSFNLLNLIKANNKNNFIIGEKAEEVTTNEL